MKKIINLVIVSIFALSFTGYAQDDNVHFDKRITGPKNGVYTLNLEAYVTGRITVSQSPAPADIVLVLDKSGSMLSTLAGYQTYYASERRINVLRSAVQKFVDTVQESNNKIQAKDKDAYGGHRIAIVWFSGRLNNDYTTYNEVYEGISGLNEFQNVEDLTTEEASSSYFGYNAAKVYYNNNDLLNVNVSEYDLTITDKAMERAESIIGGETYSDKPNRSRIVLFFTDGDPGWGTQYGWQNDNRMLGIANRCIAASNRIKESGATIYSVGLFNKSEGTADATTTYLRYTSSDVSGKTEMPTSSGYLPVSNDKSIIVSSADGLANVFDNIATASTPNTSAASASSVLVDVVATSFMIPKDTDLGTVKVFQVANKQVSSTSNLNWAPESEWVNITNSKDIDLVSDPDTGEVSVTGFDYGAEWCGWDASANNNTGGSHGSKLVLQIPIQANTNAVGGPNVSTNASGSKLVIKDKDGKELSTHEFVSPVISLPVNIHIMKKNLKEGESAKFTLMRTTLPITSSSKWDYVTSVFVTNGKSSAFEVAEDDGKSYPVTYVRGLPSATKEQTFDGTITKGYVYKIIEDNWGWSYTFDKVTGKGANKDDNTGSITVVDVSIDDKDAITSDKFVKNPIIFWNDKDSSVDTRVRYAESKATNIFSNGGTIIYDDSKPNTGAGRENTE